MTLTLGHLEKRVKYWAWRLNLEHWELDIELVDNPNDNPEAAASCETHPDYDKATLEFAKDLKDDRLERAVVHELLHVHFRGLHEAGLSLFGTLGLLAADGHRQRWGHEEENLIERLAQILVTLDKES